MLISDCEPFKWYIVITCEKCGSKQAIFRDLTEGKSKIRATYPHECEECKHFACYDDDRIERYQHIVERRKYPRT